MSRETYEAQLARLLRAKSNAVVRSSEYTERDRRRDEKIKALRSALNAASPSPRTEDRDG